MNDMRVSTSGYNQPDYSGGHHVHGDSHHIHGANHPGGANAAANKTAPESMPMEEVILEEPQLPGGIGQLIEMITKLVEMLKGQGAGESSDAEPAAEMPSHSAVMPTNEAILPEGPSESEGGGVEAPPEGGFLQNIQELMQVMLQFSAMQQLLSSFGGLFGGGSSGGGLFGGSNNAFGSNDPFGSNGLDEDDNSFF